MHTKGEWDCTCEAGYKGEVYHCPLHKAAPVLYEALKEILADLEQRAMPDKETVKQALAKAEGK